MPFNVLTMVLALIGALWIVISEAPYRPRWVPLGEHHQGRADLGRYVFAGWLFATGREGTSFPSGVILLALVILYSF